MSIAELGLTSRSYPKTLKVRGEDYFRQKRVTLQTPVKDTLSASVRGKGDTYDVSLDWSRSNSGVSSDCSCPYFGDNGQCKHVWAVFLAAERQGYLTGVTGSNGGGKAPPGTPPAVGSIAVQALAAAKAASKPNGTLSADALAILKQVILERSGPTPEPAVSTGKKAEAERKAEAAAQKRAAAAAQKKAEAAAKQRWRSQFDIIRRIDAPIAPLEEAIAIDRQIQYVLDLTDSLDCHLAVILPYFRERNKNGAYGKMKRMKFDSDDPVDWIGHPDYPLLCRLLLSDRSDQHPPRGYGSYWSSYTREIDRLVLESTSLGELLPALCHTGRLALTKESPQHMEQSDLQPLAWCAGGTWEILLTVEHDPKKKQWVLYGDLTRGEERRDFRDPRLILLDSRRGYLLLASEFVVLAEAGQAGWVDALRKDGQIVIPEEHRGEFLQEYWKLETPPKLQAPPEFTLDQVTLAPQPICKIERVPQKLTQFGGTVHFQYGDQRVSAAQGGRAIVDAAGGRILLRDAAEERRRLAELQTGGLRLESDEPASPWGRPNPLAAYNFAIPESQFMQMVTPLIDAGWIVEAEGSALRSAGKFSFNVTSGVDWFDLDASCDFGGVTAQLPELLAALRKGERFVRLGDGTRGMLPSEWLQKFGFLADLGEDADGQVRFKSSQAFLLDALLAAQTDVRVDERFAERREKLRSFRGIKPADAPPGFVGELRHYQQDGLGWLGFLQDFHLGGCLADDMGLGKTIQVLALLLSRRRAAIQAKQARKPSLIVVPKSLIFNWKEEAEKFAPELKVLDFTGIGRKQQRSEIPEHDLILTTYGTLLRDIAELKDVEFDYAILDEAQAVKNSDAQSAKACRLIRAEHRLALTGTPIENHIGELWSIFEFLNPGMLGASAAFQRFSAPAAAGEGTGRSLLAQALAPFVLRRTKSQVLTDLPEKTEQTIYCDLNPKERKKYDELREYFRQSIAGKIAEAGLEKSKIHVLEALLRLRQAACHPALLDPKAIKEPGSKLETLFEQLEELLEGGHKALVFSQFTSLLAIVKKQLDAKKIVYEYLDGQSRNRKKLVDRFQQDADCKLFLISLKAGGKGLNLTKADYVFILDPWWNPAVEAQAIDRAHRLGQERPVFAYRLIARDTVEEKIVQLQEGKRQLAESIISADSSILRGMTADDLQMLLS